MNYKETYLGLFRSSHQYRQNIFLPFLLVKDDSRNPRSACVMVVCVALDSSLLQLSPILCQYTRTKATKRDMHSCGFGVRCLEITSVVDYPRPPTTCLGADDLSEPLAVIVYYLLRMSRAGSTIKNEL